MLLLSTVFWDHSFSYLPTLHWLFRVVLRWWSRGLVSKPKFRVVGGPLLPPLLDDELTDMTLWGRLLQRLESSLLDTAIEFLNLGAAKSKKITVSCISWKIINILDDLYTLLDNCATLIERSFIWSALGLMSKHGLLPMPILDISARRTSTK